jgi:hypothetical protein
VDPAARNNAAIRWAANNGHSQVVERLLDHPRVDPAARNNAAIRWAANNGHSQVVERLLEHPRVEPDSDLIQHIAQKGHSKIVDRLLDHPIINWTTIDCSRLPRKSAFLLRRREYAKKRRALRTIVRFLYEKFGTAEKLRDHIWKPNGYLSRTLAVRHGNLT